MNVLFHTLIALFYVGLGAIISFGLPANVAGIDHTLAAVMGGTVVLCGAFAHQFVVSMRRERRMTSDLRAVATASLNTQAQIEKTRTELRKLNQTIEEQKSALEEVEENEASYQDVMGEMQMLRTLLAQLPSRKETKEESLPAAVIAPDDPEDDEAPPGYEAEPVEPSSVYRADWAQSTEPGRGAGGAGPALAVARKLDLEPRFSDEEILEITRDALEKARVTLFLQPIVQLPTRKTAYYEAFSRIKHGDDVMIGPEDYIGPAERNGLIAAIDNNLLFRCVQLIRRVRRHNKSYPFFCNVSPHTLSDTAFFPQFIDFLADNSELSSDLVFEFSQNDVGTRYDEFAENLERLATLGFRFSLDRIDRLDLNYAGLGRRYFRFVKIDAATLLTLTADDEGAARFAELQSEMIRVGVSLIVEKVESDRELVELLDHQIELGQGYLFGEPRESRAET